MAQARLPQSLLLGAKISGKCSCSFGSMMTHQILGKYSRLGSTRTEIAWKMQPLENTAVLCFHKKPNPWKIQQFWLHEDPNSLENTAVLVPQQTETPEKYNSFGSTADRNPGKYSNFGSTRTKIPKCLETHVGERNQNPWNTVWGWRCIFQLDFCTGCGPRGGTLQVGE